MVGYTFVQCRVVVRIHSSARIILNVELCYNVQMGQRGNKAKSNEEWLAIPWEELSLTAKRRVLFLLSQGKCSQCGYCKRRSDGQSILEIDHIDGDHKNSSRENLRVLCPNCHALTPNFRNWGRSQKLKTSTRFRKGNKGFEESRQLIKQHELAYVETFKTIVNETYISGEIDYSKFGWVQRLSDKLNDHPAIVGRTIRRLLPKFYVENCFRRRGGTKLQLVKQALHDLQS